ncbi:hypothetical protein VZT92_027820 [Zoarces viviparus]|uniref:Uncharacterized protein n=1 Tax=Zoarces viviparus TaxID=48416 RepID=A0AAW1DXB3_ZOAVI
MRVGPTLDSSAGFIVSKVDGVGSPSPTRGLCWRRIDTGGTDKSLSRSLRRTLPGSGVTCPAPSMWHDLNAD